MAGCRARFVGVQLFPVARQPVLGDGLRPDIVAIDGEGHVQVIEVKRDVDRGQLAQCLEYAGWARNTSLDELAGMFHGGSDSDLLDAGLLEAGAALTWARPKIGVTYGARVLETGQIQLDDGERVYASPSRAAMEAADVVAYDGWHAWRTAQGHLLADLRGQLLASNSPAEESNG